MIPRLTEEQAIELGKKLKEYREGNDVSLDEFAQQVQKAAGTLGLHGEINHQDIYQMESRGSGLRYIAYGLALEVTGFPVKEALHVVLNGNRSKRGAERGVGNRKAKNAAPAGKTRNRRAVNARAKK